MAIVKLVDQLSNDIQEKMIKDLLKYEHSHGINVNYKKFSLVLTNHKNETIGILNAYTAFSEVYVEDLWVDSLHRGKGYGRKLLQSLEDHFKGKGFNNMNLVTSQFQASGFYKKCGFTVEFM